jgi:hypothetical protein
MNLSGHFGRLSLAVLVPQSFMNLAIRVTYLDLM